MKVIFSSMENLFGKWSKSMFKLKSKEVELSILWIRRSLLGECLSFLTYTLFFHKQPVYEQPVLDRQINKQLSEKKKIWKIKLEANIFNLKNYLLGVHFFQLQNHFCSELLSFPFLYRFWGTKIRFQTFLLHG